MNFLLRKIGAIRYCFMQIQAISLIRKFYSYIVFNKLWLALEWYIPMLWLVLKVVVNRKLQKLIHGLLNLDAHIKLCMWSFSVLYCRASLTLLLGEMHGIMGRA